MSQEVPLLNLENIGKQFDGHYVLKNINLSLNKGEILGLVGENGAGKSTLMKILFGMPEIAETGGYDGQLCIDGQVMQFKSPFDALASGIGMVHQEFSLIPGFSGTENILLNMESTQPSVLSHIFGKRMVTLDRKTMKKRAETAIDTLGVKLDMDELVSEQPVGHKQFLEIAREINRENVRLLIFDEPTAVLTESEAEIFLRTLRRLSDTGIGIIFISHRLKEIVSACDRLSVLRDGEIVADRAVGDITIKEIAELMVGRDVNIEISHKSAPIPNDQEIHLEVNNLWVDMPGERVQDVSFKVRKGEIFGIGGLAGQGKLGIPNGIMGLSPAGGEVLLSGQPMKLNDPRVPLEQFIAFVSEDRRGVGLLLNEPIDWNIAFNAMQVQGKFLKKYLGGLIQFRDEKEMQAVAQKYIDLLEIRCTNSKQHTQQLSGGNQQKVCLAKAFAFSPQLLFVSEPTRGIDIGAKVLVLEALRRFSTENNTTIVMVSSELEELRAICDRIAIVSEGKVAGILPPTAKPVDFGLLMSGGITAKELVS
jgi:ABC-type sugar transport system, ATPase component